MTHSGNPTIAHPPVPPRPGTSLSDIPLDAFLQPVHRSGFVLLTIFFFMAFSRVMDVLAPSARLPFAVSVATLLCMVMSGGLMRVYQATEGKMLLAFTAWCFIGIPLSSWRGGSFNIVTQTWLKSLFCFALVVGLIVTARQARRMMVVIALATLVLSLMVLVKQHRVVGRLSFDVGMFSNPNDLAQALLLGVPLLFALNVPQSNAFLRIVTAAAAAPMLLAVVQTGSRSALLAIAVMIVMTFLRVGYMGRLALVLVIAGGVVFAVVALPRAVMSRYMLMLTDTDDVRELPFEGAQVSKTEAIAVASSESRKFLLLQSLRFTIQHPIFGVGPGTFQHVSVQETASEGKRSMWRETHNMYTQISSETGLTGFFLYFGTLAVLFRKFRSLRLRCEGDRRLDSVRHLLLIYSTSFISVLVTGAFSSIGYQLLVPTMIGLASVLHAGCAREVERITALAPAVPKAQKPARRPVPKLPPGLGLPRPLRPQPAVVTRMRPR
jgi:O-antigen ligase